MTQPRVRQIPALTGIRIIAAMWVVVEHFRAPMFGLFPQTKSASSLIEGGYLGVEVFFVLSGFIISHNYADRFRSFSPSNYRRFLQNRFARLYPVHLVTLAIVVLLVMAANILNVRLNSDGMYDPLSFVMNILMLQAVPPASAWNGPAWSISAEAAAYVLFPLLAIAVMRVRSRVVLLLGLTGAALGFTIGGQFFLASMYDFSPTGHGAIWFRIAGEFTAGCFLWRFWAEWVEMSRKHDAYALIGAAGVAVILMFSGEGGPSDFLALPFIALFILAAASATCPVGKFLSSRAMDYGGRISYSLYMVHFLVLMGGGKLLPWETFEGSHLAVRIVVLMAYFGMSLVCAGLLYRFVEEPGRRAIARIGTTKRGPIADASAVSSR